VQSEIKQEIAVHAKYNILKKLEENKEEMKTQNAQIEKMQMKIREIIGSETNSKMKQGVGASTVTNYGSLAEEILNGAGSALAKSGVPVKIQTQPKTGKIC
jgi:ribosomal protein L9